ncbi:hypothetical protein THAOC_24759, partial [Thalassiosira oceanica]
SGTIPSNFVIAAVAAADVSLTPEGAATFKPAELPLPSASIVQECCTSPNQPEEIQNEVDSLVWVWQVVWCNKFAKGGGPRRENKRSQPAKWWAAGFLHSKTSS